MKRLLLRHVVEIAILVILHWILLHWLAEKNTMAVVFAAGKHVPLSQLALAGGFLLLRLWVILILPGAILYRLVMLLTRQH